MKTLLNFKIDKDMEPKDFEPIFEEIANKILNGCGIIVKKDKESRVFRIVEIEFYVKHEKVNFRIEYRIIMTISLIRILTK